MAAAPFRSRSLSIARAPCAGSSSAWSAPRRSRARSIACSNPGSPDRASAFDPAPHLRQEASGKIEKRQDRQAQADEDATEAAYRPLGMDLDDHDEQRDDRGRDQEEMKKEEGGREKPVGEALAARAEESERVRPEQIEQPEETENPVEMEAGPGDRGVTAAPVGRFVRLRDRDHPCSPSITRSPAKRRSAGSRLSGRLPDRAIIRASWTRAAFDWATASMTIARASVWSWITASSA